MGCCGTQNEEKANNNPKDKRPENTQKPPFIKENHIPGHAESESTFQIEKIMKQMKKSVCKIDGQIKGTGFLCLIPFPNILHPLNVLITCNHVFNDISIGSRIKLVFDDGKEKIIELDKSRKVYTNKENDITIIELKENEFDLEDYLKLDDDIDKVKEYNEIYKNKSIYIIHYPKGKEVKNSIDTITI